jgi:hypothetical protein
MWMNEKEQHLRDPVDSGQHQYAAPAILRSHLCAYLPQRWPQGWNE